jgi:hypothetical protein
MKLLITAALIGATVSATAFAQSNTQNYGANFQTANTEAGAPVSPSWSASSSAPGKTRAQVYQELVQAQQDGQMAYLKELYKGR